MWDAHGKNLNVHQYGHSQGRDLVVRQQEVRVRRVGQDGQRGDIVEVVATRPSDVDAHDLGNQARQRAVQGVQVVISRRLADITKLRRQEV